MTQPVRLLLLDDEPDDRRLAIRELQREFSRLDVCEIHDGQGLAEALKGEPFDAVITDYRLRWADGLEVLLEVKRRWPKCPVIMFTNTGNEELAVEAMKAGLNDYVLKSPKHFARLRAALRASLDQAQSRAQAQAALHASEEHYRRLVETVNATPWEMDVATGRFTYVAPQAVKLLGYPADAWYGANFWVEHIHADDRARVVRSYRDLAACGQEHELEYRMLAADGRVVCVHNSVNVACGEDGRTWLRGFMLDITGRREAERALRDSEAQVRLLLESTGEAIYGVDLAGNCTFANPACLRLLGYEAVSEVLGKNMHDLIHHTRADGTPHPRNDCNIYQAFIRDESAHGDDEMLWRKDGRGFPVEYWSYPIRRDGEVVGSVVTFIDITERKHTQERLQYLAHHDVLTRLPNRVLFADRLRHALAHARRNDRAVALLFLDLDRFKIINDTLGHDMGDRSLQALAERLALCVRDGDTIARLGGDEFAVILEDIAAAEDVAPMARKILDVLSQPLLLDERELFVTTSIGISLFPTDGKDSQALLKHADIAMYRAKEQGRNTYQFYSADMSAKAFERLNLETSLRHALAREEFRLLYQPQVDAATGRVSGVEALLRWQHPEFGLVAPDQFVSLLEDTGLIVPVGEWVLRTACRQARAWRAGGLQLGRMAVNLSGRQFAKPGFAELVRRIIEDSALEPACLELEITESTLMGNEHVTARTFRSLEELETRLAVDDFGVGYSSLSYLRRFPINTLKIDRSFIRDAATDADNAAIVQAIIAMAHSLKLEVIAEGVETEDQLDFLRRQGCNGMQGYLFSRPLNAEEVVPFLGGGAAAHHHVTGAVADL